MKNLFNSRKNLLVMVAVLVLAVVAYVVYRKHQNKQTQKKVDEINPADEPIGILVSK